MRMSARVETIESAFAQFADMRRYRPFMWSGKWYVAQVATNEFVTYRTKKAAIANTISNVWFIQFEGTQ